MPTYNGERFIRESLASLLAQDYPNIEIVISDNASIDGTEQICREFAAAHHRIRYVRSAINVGSIANFNRALTMSVGTYFMWAADHDQWHPSFVRRAVDILEATSETVLVYPRTLLVDEHGAEIELMDDQIDLSCPSAKDRYVRLIWELTACNMVHGLARREALAAIGGFGAAFAPDHILLARLTLRGRIERIADPLFYRRQNRPPETEAERLNRVMDDLDPATAALRKSQQAAQLYREMRDAHIGVVRSSSLGPLDKAEAYVSTMLCFRQRFGVSEPLLEVLARGSHVIPFRRSLLGRLGVQWINDPNR
jgi:glycosyltransferase involved in cell wall biosynthesis